MQRLNLLDWIALVLLIAGGINWGLIGLFGYDLLGAIFVVGSTLLRIIYTLVGIAALYTIFIGFRQK